MRHLTVRTATTAAVAIVATLLAVPASATPTWVDAPDAADTGDQVTQLHADSVPAEPGPASSVLVWVDASTDDVVATQRPAGGAWAAPVALAKPSTAPRIETVTPYSDGVGHVQVTYRVGSTLQSVTYNLPPTSPGVGPVTAPVTVSSTYVAGTASSYEGELTWAEEVGGGQQRLVGQRNGALEVLEAPAAVTYHSTASTLVGDTATEGDAEYVAWVAETTGGAQQLYVKREAGAATPLGAAGSTFGDPVIGAGGNLAWAEKPATGTARIRVAQLPFAGTVTAADVPGGPGAAADPSLAQLAGSGRILVWREQDGNTWSIRSSTALPVSDVWTPATTLETGTGTLAARQFSAASSPTGQVVSWCAPSGADCSVRGSFRAGKTWRPVTALGTVADADDARLARSTGLGYAGQSAPPTAWTAGGDDVRVSAIDHRPPVTQSTPKPVATFNGGVSTYWSAVDDWSNVASYRLETSVVPFRRHPQDDAEWRAAQPTTATSRRLPVGPGQTRCWHVNATDAVGNLGADSSDQCIIAPLDDRLLTRSASWRNVRDSLSMQGTLLRSSTKGATITIKDYPFTQVLVLARRLPSGGKFEVLLNGKRVRSFTTAGTSRRTVAFASPSATSPYQNAPRANRTLQIRVITDGKPVYIDGLFLGGSLPSSKQVNLLTR